MNDEDLKRVLEALKRQAVPVTLGKVSGLPFVRASEMWAYDVLPSGFHCQPTSDVDREWLVILKTTPKPEKPSSPRRRP